MCGWDARVGSSACLVRARTLPVRCIACGPHACPAPPPPPPTHPPQKPNPTTGELYGPRGKEPTRYGRRSQAVSASDVDAEGTPGRVPCAKLTGNPFSLCRARIACVLFLVTRNSWSLVCTHAGDWENKGKAIDF